MEHFQGHSESFYATLVDDRNSDDVRVTLSLEGLVVTDRAGRLTKRKIPLDHITRWTRQSDRLTMFIKTPVDLEENAVSFYASGPTLSSMLDTLTSTCLQMVEIMEAREEQETANEMRAVARNGGRRHKQLKNADEVEFWLSPEKAGWLQSQGEIVKTWRRRWFILKDGFLFRFLDDKVEPTSKPRGVVDLSKVGEISEGRSVTNRANSIRVGQQKGWRAYLADNETEQVEWISALEATVSRLVRVIAGVDDDDDAPSAASAASVAAAAPLVVNLPPAPRSSAPERRGQPAFAFPGGAGYPNLPAAPVGPPAAMYTRHAPAEYGARAGGPGYGGSMSSRPDISRTYEWDGSQRPSPAPSALPATLTVSDPYAGVTHGSQQQGGQAGWAGAAGGGGYGYGSGGYQDDRSHAYGGAAGGAGARYEREAPQPVLPETLNVMSIIDQPPLQQPSYGLGAGQAYGPGYSPAYGSPAPQHHQQPPAAEPGAGWTVHHTPEQRPYYYNASTGQTSWVPPA